MVKGRLPRVPKLCRRKDRRLYATDPHTRRPVYFKTPQEYEDWRQAFLSRIKQLLPGTEPDRLHPGERITVARLCCAYLDHAERWYRKDGKPTSEVGVIKMMLRHLDATLGDRQVNSLRPRDIENVQQSMIDADLSRRTCNHLLKKLKTMMRWGVRQEVVTGETLGRILSVPGLQKGRSKAREKPAVKPVDLQTVEDTLPGLRPIIQAMVTVQLYGGMRPGEVCSLKAEEIDRSTEPWEYRPGRYKTEHRHEDDVDDDRRRRVMFGPRVREALLPLLDECWDCSKPLFRSRRGKLMSAAIYRADIAHACRKLGIPHWFPNQLRHTMGTAIRKRFGAEAARAFLGHENLKTTEIYAEVDAEKIRKVAEDMG